MDVTRSPHALRRTPMLLAVTPFPNPLTTPPVTRTYFIFSSQPQRRRLSYSLPKSTNENKTTRRSTPKKDVDKSTYQVIPQTHETDRKIDREIYRENTSTISILMFFVVVDSGERRRVAAGKGNIERGGVGDTRE